VERNQYRGPGRGKRGGGVGKESAKRRESCQDFQRKQREGELPKRGEKSKQKPVKRKQEKKRVQSDSPQNKTIEEGVKHLLERKISEKRKDKNVSREEKE